MKVFAKYFHVLFESVSQSVSNSIHLDKGEVNTNSQQAKLARTCSRYNDAKDYSKWHLEVTVRNRTQQANARSADAILKASVALTLSVDTSAATWTSASANGVNRGQNKLSIQSRRFCINVDYPMRKSKNSPAEPR